MSDILSRLVSNNNTSASAPSNEANQKTNNNNKENNNSNNSVFSLTLLAHNHNNGNRAKNHNNNKIASFIEVKDHEQKKMNNKSNNNNNNKNTKDDKENVGVTLQKLIELLRQNHVEDAKKLLHQAADAKKLLESEVDFGPSNKGTPLLISGLHSSPRALEMLLQFIEQYGKEFSKQQLQPVSKDKNSDTLLHRILFDSSTSATEKFKIAMTFANKVLDEDELKNLLRVKPGGMFNAYALAFIQCSLHHSYDLMYLVVKTHKKLGRTFFEEIINDRHGDQKSSSLAEFATGGFPADMLHLHFTTIENVGGIEMLKKHVASVSKDFPGTLISAAATSKKPVLKIVLDVFEKIGDKKNLRQILLSSNLEGMTLCMTVCKNVDSAECLKIFFDHTLRVWTDESFLKTMLSSEGADGRVGLHAILSNEKCTGIFADEEVAEDTVYYFCSLLWKYDLFLKHFVNVSSDKKLQNKLKDFNIDASYQGETVKTAKQDWVKVYNKELEKHEATKKELETRKKQLDEEHQKHEATKKELEKEKNKPNRLQNQINNLEQQVVKQKTEAKSAKDELTSVKKRAQEEKKSFEDQIRARDNKINQKEENLFQQKQKVAALQKQLDAAHKAGNNNIIVSNNTNNDDDDNNQDEIVAQLKQEVDAGKQKQNELEDKLKEAEAIISQCMKTSDEEITSLRHQLEAATKSGKKSSIKPNNNNIADTISAANMKAVEKERDELKQLVEELQAAEKKRQQQLDVLKEMLEESNKACTDLRVEVRLLKKFGGANNK